MPEAIATTKRKFYKALDSLTNGSQASLDASRSGSAASSATIKRPLTATDAFEEARERAKKRLRHSVSGASSASSLAAIPLGKPSAAASSRDEAASRREPPNYSPWSHDLFLARLKTFSSVSMWHPKPEVIGEVEWAKRGWVCVAVNTVGCRGGCEKRVVVSMNIPLRAAVPDQDPDGDSDGRGDEADDEEAALESALAERYKDLLVEGHAESCLWRRSGCKDDIYRLQVVRPTVWQPELRTRYASLVEMASAIQAVRVRGVGDAEHDVQETSLRSPPAGLLGAEVSMNLDEAVRRQAFAMSMHGWQGSVEAGSELLRCDACFQRIGLWMYQPDYRPSIMSIDDTDDQGPATIDLLESHRDHCPWRNADSQKSAGSLSGLNATQILYRVVATYAREQQRRLNEGSARSEGQELSLANDIEGTPADEPILSRDEVARQDKERESKLKRLKSLFSIKRRPTKAQPGLVQH